MRPRTTAALALAFPSAYLACADSGSQSTGPETSRVAQTLEAPGRIVTLDEAILELGRDMPGGFGGIYRDSDGAVVLLLKDTSMGNGARDHLMARQNPNVSDRARISRSQIRVQQAEHTWQELWDIYQDLDPVIGHPSFVRSDMDERRNMIEVEMDSPGAVREARSIIKLLGVSESAVQVRVGERARSLADLNDQVRDSIPGGYKAVSEYATVGCTIGANARKATDWGYGFVTNSHCTNKFMGLDASSVDDWWQPTESAGNFIGTEVKDADPVDSSVIPQCPTTPPGIRCRYSDAAIVQFDDSTYNNLGYIERTTAGTITVDTNGDDWEIVDTDNDCPWPQTCTLDNLQLEFVGMASGWETGRRDSTQLCTIEAPERDNTKRLICQFWVTTAGADGDSGAAVFEIDNDPEVIMYGVLWGGTGGKVVYSRIAWASSELGGFSVIAPPVIE